MFTISIETDNAAFGPTPVDRAAAIAAILRNIAVTVENYAPVQMERVLYDLNGNACGAWDLAPFDFATHGETDPDEEEDAPSVDPSDIDEITCTYGGSKTPATCYTWAGRSGTWYAIEGSLNVNCTFDDLAEGVDVEELNDHDTGTAAAPINSAEDMARFCSDL